MNLVTPKVGAEHEILLNKPAFEIFIDIYGLDQEFFASNLEIQKFSTIFFKFILEDAMTLSITTLRMTLSMMTKLFMMTHSIMTLRKTILSNRLSEK